MSPGARELPRSCSCTPPRPTAGCGRSTWSGWQAITAWPRTCPATAAAPDLPGHGRSNQLPWTSLDDTAQQVAALIEDRVPARRAHVVGLSQGGALVHKLLAHRPELLDRVVIDGCGGGVLLARGTGLWKLAFALTAPLLHRKLVIGLLYRYLGGDPSDRAG